jgi:hypothetical protein
MNAEEAAQEMTQQQAWARALRAPCEREQRRDARIARVAVGGWRDKAIAARRRPLREVVNTAVSAQIGVNERCIELVIFVDGESILEEKIAVTPTAG